jgi:hypothetical protein
MSDEKLPRRLRLARAALRVEWDDARVARVVEGVGPRRRKRRRRLALAGGVAAAALALWAARSVERPSTSGERTVAERRARVAPVAGFPVEPASEVPEPAPKRRPLADLAGEPGEASQRWAAYAAHPDADPTIPNVSYAGYHQGAAIPEPAAQVNVRAFGATGDGVTDDTDAIRRAIASAEGRSAAVYLPDGHYLVSGVLYVHGNGTVLRGEHRAGTQLVFRQSLDRALGPNVVGPFSRWQWSGGLVWFAPRSRPLYQPAGRPLGMAGEGWGIGAPLASVAPALRGDRALTLSAPAPVAAGDLVFLVVEASEALAAAGWRLEQDNRHERSAIPAAARAVRWPVEIAAVSGNTLTLAQPLRFDLPGHAHLHLAQPDALVRDVGVERLTLVMRREPAPPGLAEPFGWNGLFFQNVLHAFAREVTVIDGDVAVASVATKNLSVTDLDVVAQSLRPGRPNRGAMTLRGQSHDVLLERVTFDSRHWSGLGLEGSGFAVSRARGRFEVLGGYAVDSVLTEIVNVGREAVGGAPGERLVGWNLRKEGGSAPAWSDAPANLYEAQKALRRR